MTSAAAAATSPSSSSTMKLEHHKLIALSYSTKDGSVHECLLSFHETDGTFSIVKCLDDGSTSIDPLSISNSSSSATTVLSAIACSGDGERIAVGYKDGSTRIFSFTADQLLLSSGGLLHPFFTNNDEDDFDYIAGPRFQSCVRALQFDPRSSSSKGYFLAAASDDYTCGVCIVDLHNLEERYLVDSSSSYGGVHSLAYTPTVENDTVLLSALGIDGKLTHYTCMGLDQPDVYWDVLHRETLPVVATTFAATDTMDASNKVAPPIIAWSPDGSILAIPGSMDVQLRLRGDMSKKYYLYSNSTEGVGQIVACTIQNDVLVSLTRNGTACIWKLEQDIAKRQDSLGRFHKSLLPMCNYPTSIVFTKTNNKKECSICIQSATKSCHSTLLSSSSDDDDEPARCSKKIAPEENDTDDEESIIQFDTQPVMKPNIFVEDEAKEDDDDDDSMTHHSNEIPSIPDTTQEYHHDDDDDDDDDVANREDALPTMYYATRPQEAFAPSSTPLHDDDTLDARRILCWNHVGVATSRTDVARGGSIIDVNFTDVSITGSYKTFFDSYGFELGSLSEEGAIFATLEDTGSRIYYNRFETIGLPNKKDWTMILPDGEGVLGCACGEGWVAVVTSRRFLRLIGSGGMQRSITWLKGDPVTIVGRGRLLAVVYHESVPLPDKTQQLGYMLLDGVDGAMISSGSLSAVGCGQKLTWIGFSNDFSLVVMDSGGMLTMLNASAGWQWTPMLDTLGKKKSDDDSFWPVTVLDGKLLCVPLKGGHEHPDATRRPVTTALELRMPMASSVLKKSFQLEETSARANVSLIQKKFVHDLLLKEGADPIELEEEYARSCAQVDKVTLRLFHESLQANLYERALDVVARLHLEKSFDIALTISEQFRSRALSDRIEMIKFAKFSSFDNSVPEDNNLGVVNEYTNSQRALDAQVGSSLSRISPDCNLSQSFGQHKRKVVDSNSAEINHEQPFTNNNNVQQTLNPFAKRQILSPTKHVNKSKAALVGSVNSPKPQLLRNSAFTSKSKEETRTKKNFL